MSASPNLTLAGSGVIGQLNGRPSDFIDQVGTPRVLEHGASPTDPADVRHPKKAKGEIPPNDLADEVCAMEAEGAQDPILLRRDPTLNMGHGLDVNGGSSKVGDRLKDSSGASERKGAASYAQVTASGLNREGWFADEQSLKTDEVVVLEEDCIISEDGDFSTIKFSERVHAQVDKSLSNTVVDECNPEKVDVMPVTEPRRRSAYGRDGRIKPTGAANLATGSRFTILREDSFEHGASRMEDDPAAVDINGNKVIGLARRPTSGGNGAGNSTQIEVVALESDHPLGVEEHSVTQGNDKHADLRIVDKGGVSKGPVKARPGSTGFKVGKLGRDNVVKGNFSCINVDNRKSDNVAVSDWINSISNQVDDFAAQNGFPVAGGMRSMEEDDPGDDLEVGSKNDTVIVNEDVGSGIGVGNGKAL
ncbi:hypothetical protein V6N11_081845 [Hibiscus sabdariffa]|uniref:Uncharacterized protein n=1 Tax=Hibiscus sabdariffa TaxID=183260 RepID=A0ABR2Q7A5_9ROSI